MTFAQTEVGELWQRINREAHDCFRQAFKGSPLPFRTLFLLRRIHQQPGVTISELSRQSGIAKSHVSKMTNQLVRQGYVEKLPDPTDQRLVRIHPTASGNAVMADMEARAQEAWASVVAQLPDGQIGEVLQGLHLLLAALERANASF